MPRPLRVEYPGALYHVLSRGDRREAIVHDDLDRRLFLDTLGAACAKTGWQVHAWVLMGNHFHLLASIHRPNLSRWTHAQLASAQRRFDLLRSLSLLGASNFDVQLSNIAHQLSNIIHRRPNARDDLSRLPLHLQSLEVGERKFTNREWVSRGCRWVFAHCSRNFVGRGRLIFS